MRKPEGYKGCDDCDANENEFYSCNCIVFDNELDSLTQEELEPYYLEYPGFRSFMHYCYTVQEDKHFEKEYDTDDEDESEDDPYKEYKYVVWGDLDDSHRPIRRGRMRNIDYWFYENSCYKLECFLAVLRCWKEHPPPVKVIEDFIQVANTYTIGFDDHLHKPVMYTWFTPNYTKEIFFPIMDLVLSFKGIDLRSLYQFGTTKKSLIEVFSTQISLLEEVIDILETPLDEGELVRGIEKPDFKVSSEYEIFYSQVPFLEFCEFYNSMTFGDDRVADNWSRKATTEAKDIGVENFVNNKFFGNRKTFDSFLREIIANPPPQRMINALIDMLRTKTSRGYNFPLVCMYFIDVLEPEITLRIFKNLMRLGLDTECVYDYKYTVGNLAHICRDWKSDLVTLREKMIKVLAKQIIVRAYRNAKDDKYVMTRLHRSIELHRITDMLKEKE